MNSELFQTLPLWLIGLASVIAALGGLGIALNANRQRIIESKYDNEAQRAVLSLMRDTYEERIADLNERLTATQDRWKEVNHLLLDAQSVQQTSPGHRPISADRFLRGFGIDPDSIIVDNKLIFVLTPFTKREQRTFDAIQKGCANAAFRCVRGDEERITGPILPHILRQIASSRLVIANISTRNPNVFYELGIAQALGKPTILISKSIDDAPFDVQGSQIVQFVDTKSLSPQITDEIRKLIADEAQLERQRPRAASEAVTIGRWELNFNPRSPRGRKAMTFLPGGKIGEGRNENEFRWRVDDDVLTIFRQDGSLQNRFAFDPNAELFVCLDDPQALGIKGQTIYRA